jgi:hypothetical protein
MSDEREEHDDDPGQTQPATERVTKESIGEGEPGAARHVTGENAVDQADTADERL